MTRRNSQTVTLDRLNAMLDKARRQAAASQAMADSDAAAVAGLQLAIEVLTKPRLPGMEEETAEGEIEEPMRTYARPPVAWYGTSNLTAVPTVPFKPAPRPVSACPHSRTGVVDGRQVCIVCGERVPDLTITAWQKETR